ncbi:General stress protein 39 [Candidatus Promineifilum breve]|uniref:General stress protein 39 n=1 Tax=Candidatus Promineifilum breve TaxID=1806508 RepID=A0A160T6Y6_9CHLR|nr:SDR family oxidoreductase [Candidatus Promineifilum breve]CUS05814.1 General stress protein 39 [Candidatus Promineifilum breve]
MSKKQPTPQDIPPQTQRTQPGRETRMTPRPQFAAPDYRPADKLAGKVALITGGDSGIGRAVAVIFAREGADIAIVYLNEHDDAQETQRLVKAEGRRCILMDGDAGDATFCRQAVARTVRELGGLNVLVNNAAEQHPQERFEDITAEQWEKTFRTNIHAYFYLTHAALPHLGQGDTIINTTSVTAYRGSPHLVDYSATKGAIVTFTRSLGIQLAQRGTGIRVNGVAPGPIWTPLIPSTFTAGKVDEFGADTPMARPGQPEEVAPAYVFLASTDSSYITGQVIHPNGGEIVNA